MVVLALALDPLLVPCHMVPLASYLPIDELEVNVMVAYKTGVDVDIVVVVARALLVVV